MATLTATKILADTVAAFRTRTPMLGAMGLNFGAQPLRLGETVMAHVRTLPTIASYDGTTGYLNGATEGNTLLTDVPVVIDSHQHVPIKWSHLQNIADQKDNYAGAIGDQAYVLGKAIVDSVLNKVRSANISYANTTAEASTDRSTLNVIRAAMNVNGAATTGRVGIVNSTVFSELDEDARISSKDYAGQQLGGSSLGILRGIAGFDAIYEYPDFDANNAAAQTFTAATTDICTATAHGLATGDRVRLTTTTTLPAGLSLATDYYVSKIDADTFKLATTRALAVSGTFVDITGTGTGTHTITGYENVTGFFFESRAFALVAGIPNHTAEMAAAMGVPQVMRSEVVTDPESGLTLMGIYQQSQNTANLLGTVTSIWGSRVGNGSGAAGTITDKAAYILRSA